MGTASGFRRGTARRQNDKHGDCGECATSDLHRVISVVDPKGSKCPRAMMREA